MRKWIIIGAILVALIVLLIPTGRLFLILWTDKTVYEVKEGIKTAGVKHKSKEELKPIVREYVKELFEGHPPILPRWYVRMKSLVNLGKPGIEILIEILKDKEEGKNMVRMGKSKYQEHSMRIATLYVIKQITDLGKNGSKDYKEAYETIREQVPAFVEILLHDEDAKIREETAGILGHIGDDRSVEGLVKALKDDDAMVEIQNSGKYHYGVRVAAAWALGAIGDGRAVEPLIESLIKYGIGGALAEFGDRRAVRPMIQRILEEKDETHRRLLIGYLGKLGGGEAVDFLLQELKENKYDAKRNVIEALGYAKDPRAVEPLIEILLTERDFYKVNTAEALANIGDKRAIGPIKETLKTLKKTRNDPDDPFVKRMKEALNKLQ